MRRLVCSLALYALAPALTAAQPAAATTAAESWSIQPSPNVPHYDNVLASVAATSASNAWAVGDHSTGTVATDRTLIEHWNGRRWAVQSSPSVGTQANVLASVAATSAANAWAVGSHPAGSRRRTLVLNYH